MTGSLKESLWRKNKTQAMEKIEFNCCHSCLLLHKEIDVRRFTHTMANTKGTIGAYFVGASKAVCKCIVGTLFWLCIPNLCPSTILQMVVLLLTHAPLDRVSFSLTPLFLQNCCFPQLTGCS